MCLLIVSFHTESGLPLVVAANRDERYDRAATTVAIRSDNPRVLAGRDDVAGGTWMAVNDRGVIAGLTNQPSADANSAGRRSRGKLPLLLAQHATASAAVDSFLRIVTPAEYGHCWLMVGDRQSLYSIAMTSDDRIDVRQLVPGRYVLENGPIDVATAKTEFVKCRLDKLQFDLGEQELCCGLIDVLSDHTIPPPTFGPFVGRREFSCACVHTQEYGTRSSMVVVVPEEIDTRPSVFVADGPPCTNKFRDASYLWSQ